MTEVRVDGSADAEVTLLLAHGAGAGMDHPFMAAMAEALAAQGLRVVRFEFPYMVQRRSDGKKRPPDRMSKLLDAYRDQIRQIPASRLLIGGKSMGGRVASLLEAEAETLGVAGIVCLGFPFHPPGKPDNYRGEHLQHTQVPTLILQGERDPFGRREEVEGYPLSPSVQITFVTDGEHGFKPRKSSGATLEENMHCAARAIGRFATTLANV